MNIQEREDRNNFINDLPDGLWTYLVLICGTTLDFYSLEKPEQNTDNDVAFFLDLLKNEEKNIGDFRSKFKIYIENNGGKFKELKEFPEYFHPRDKKIRNFEADKIRAKLSFEKDTEIRSKLINELSMISEDDNPKYKTLTKNEEVEYCLFWAIRSCRYHFEKMGADSFLGLSKAILLYGYGCGLLGLDIFGMYYKLNEDKTAQEKGGDVLKNKAQLAESKLIQLWNQRFHNSGLTAKEKINKTDFARYILRNPNLICDFDGTEIKDSDGNSWYGVESTITRKLGAYEKACKG